MSEKPHLDCQKVHDAGWMVNAHWGGCCGSCHYDEEDGYDDLYDSDPDKPYSTHLCCGARQALAGITDEQIMQLFAEPKDKG